MVAQSFDIFVSVGTHPSPFNRLLLELDNFAKTSKLKIFVQTGTSTYKPNNYQYKQFVSPEEYEQLTKKSKLIIGHGGAGIIGTALSENKPLIIVPRLLKFKEHTNNHQLELANQLEKEKIALVVRNISDLANAINESQRKNPKKKISNSLMKSILSNYLKKNFFS